MRDPVYGLAGTTLPLREEPPQAGAEPEYRTITLTSKIGWPWACRVRDGVLEVKVGEPGCRGWVEPVRGLEGALEWFSEEDAAKLRDFFEDETRLGPVILDAACLSAFIDAQSQPMIVDKMNALAKATLNSATREMYADAAQRTSAEVDAALGITATDKLQALAKETLEGEVLLPYQLVAHKPRIYIAGPMTGLPENNYPAFNTAAAAWRAVGWDVVNPAEAFDGDQNLPYHAYVAHDVRVLQTVQAIALLPGWNNPKARGSVWECEIARDILHLAEYDATDPVPPGVEPRRTEPLPETPFVVTDVARANSTVTLEPIVTGITEWNQVERSKASNPKDIIGSNKIPLHLCPTTLVAGVALAMLEGAVKYGRSNFRAVGVRASIYYDAARRHLDAWFEGEDIDPDSKLDHLFKAAACIAVLIDAKYAGKLNDDRMVQGGYIDLVRELTPHVPRLKAQHADKTPKHYMIGDEVDG